MTTFHELEIRRPPGAVVVPPHAWATTWDDRPEEEVCIGLRFVPEGELEDARLEALKRAEKLVPNYMKTEERTQLFVLSFQDALMRWIIGRGTCDPNDVRKPWDLWSAAPEDMPRDTLTDLGAKLIFDEWEKMRIACDIGTPAADDEALERLPALLERLPALRESSRARELRVRRLMQFVLDELSSVAPPGDVNPG